MALKLPLVVVDVVEEENLQLTRGVAVNRCGCIGRANCFSNTSSETLENAQDHSKFSHWANRTLFHSKFFLWADRTFQLTQRFTGAL